MKIKLLITAFVLTMQSFCPTIVKGQIHVAGNVSGIWTKANSPYFVTDDITVLPDDSLIIEPGVQVRFQGHYKFVVTGFLKAIGTSVDQILFTRDQPVETNNWSGLGFNFAKGPCCLKYCLIEFVNQENVVQNPFEWKGCIHSEYSEVKIHNCQIKNNHGNWAAIYIGLESEDCLISNNIVENNIGNGIHSTECKNITINNNTVISNTDLGIWCSNLRSDNEQRPYRGILINNIVIDNERGIGGHGGGSLYVAFNNLWNNTTDYDFYKDRPPIFEVPFGTGDVLADPCLIPSNFNLQSNSPCIDAGDPTSPLDPDGTRADIGAYYFHQGDNVAPEIPENLQAQPGDNSVKLSWLANTEADLSHYKIYRSQIQGFFPAISDLLTIISAPNTNYIDNNVLNGQTYYYRISAVDSSNNESDFSPAARATPQAEEQPPVVSFTPARVDFGAVLLNSTKSGSICIKNVGQDSLFISNIQNRETAFGANPKTGSVAAGDSLIILLSFTPQAEIAYQDTFRISSNDPETPQALFPVSGKGIPAARPGIVIESHSHDFGGVPIFSTSSWLFEILNTGTATLMVQNLQSDNPVFSVNSPSFNIAPMSEKKVEIQFTPNNLKVQTGNLLILSNDPAQPQRTVQLTGCGIDNEPPEIFLENSQKLWLNREAQITTRITDNWKIASVRLFHRKVTDSAFQFQNMTVSENDRYQTTIAATAITLEGILYFIQATDEAGLTTISDTLSSEVYFNSGSMTINCNHSGYPDGYPRGQWQMISIPAVIDSPAIKTVLDENQLGAYGEPNWRLFLYEDSNGDGTADSYAEYSPNSTQFHFAPGRAFWLKTNPRGNRLNLDAGTGYVLAIQPEKITVKPGWNQIGNPFPFPIEFSPQNESVVSKLYQPNGKGGYTLVSFLEPWTGYFCYVYGNSTIDIQLSPRTERPAQKSQVLSDDWLCEIKAFAGEFMDENNYFGTLHDALNERDKHDYPEPPILGECVSLHFTHKNLFSDNCEAYASDIRGDLNGGQLWDLAVEGNSIDNDITLSWTFPKTIPSGLNLMLFDKTRNQLTDMRAGQSYIFTKIRNEKKPNFQIIAGNNDFLDRELSELQATYPDRFLFYQNYPNPFNSECTIQYQISNGTSVQLEIYNLMGQVVKILVNEQKAAGVYKIQWDGTNEQQQAVVSGVYFCVLTAGANTGKMKVILLR